MIKKHLNENDQLMTIQPVFRERHQSLPSTPFSASFDQLNLVSSTFGSSSITSSGFFRGKDWLDFMQNPIIRH